jgi:23S rRNA (adenine2503-C2)-methyltransferase
MITPPTLTGLRPQELALLLGEEGRPSPTRANAFLRWLWQPRLEAPWLEFPQGVEGVSKAVVRRLHEQVSLPDISETTREVASDGTIKLLLSASGAPIECVMIPGRGRTTVCVSSQSGCTRDCTFCATARMGFRRNLQAGEIVAQVMLARTVAPPDRPVRNIVFMGMGEPLDNLEEVLRAVDVLTAPAGAGLAPSHITVSTSGVLPRMRAFVERCPAQLALSLNGTTEAQRREAMPIDKKWPLPTLLEFLREYSDRRMFFIEYILMGGFNDSLEDAARLVELMRGLNVRINLIPFNPHPGTRFERPEPAQVQAFFEHLNANAIRTMVRIPRGDDIAAACGQLHRKHERSPLFV